VGVCPDAGEITKVKIDRKAEIVKASLFIINTPSEIRRIEKRSAFDGSLARSFYKMLVTAAVPDPIPSLFKLRKFLKQLLMNMIDLFMQVRDLEFRLNVDVIFNVCANFVLGDLAVLRDQHKA
jgi:hypothetical protein